MGYPGTAPEQRPSWTSVRRSAAAWQRILGQHVESGTHTVWVLQPRLHRSAPTMTRPDEATAPRSTPPARSRWGHRPSRSPRAPREQVRGGRWCSAWCVGGRGRSRSWPLAAAAPPASRSAFRLLPWSCARTPRGWLATSRCPAPSTPARARVRWTVPRSTL